MSSYALLDLAVVNAKKFVRAGGHVDLVGLLFRFLFHHEEIDRVVRRCELKQCAHDLEERLSKPGISMLGGTVALLIHRPGLVDARIDAGEGGDRGAVVKTRDIADLSHKLRSIRGPHAMHGHHGIVFRERRSKLVHGLAERFDLFGDRIQLFDIAEDQLLVNWILRDDGNQLLGGIKKLFRLIWLEDIAMMQAEVPVTLCEGFQADLPDTVHMPKGVDVIDPFLAPVGTDGAGKQIICTGIGQVQKGDQIVLQCNLLLHEEVELRIQRFQLFSSGIHS